MARIQRMIREIRGFFSSAARNGADTTKWFWRLSTPGICFILYVFLGMVRQRGGPMNKRDLKKYKTLLEQKRDVIVSSTGKKTHWDNMENTRHGDFVDQASDDNEVHVNIKLLQTDAKLLRAIEAAIARIDNGVFGVCSECEEEISVARLNAVPWTSVCIACKEKKTA
jgi:DnaK suppressor protein